MGKENISLSSQAKLRAARDFDRKIRHIEWKKNQAGGESPVKVSPLDDPERNPFPTGAKREIKESPTPDGGRVVVTWQENQAGGMSPVKKDQYNAAGELVGTWFPDTGWS